MNKCNLTNQQLIEACEEEVSKMCKTGGRSFTMRVPVNFEKDTDMLLSELNQRFKHAIGDIKELRKIPVKTIAMMKTLKNLEMVSGYKESVSKWDKLISELDELLEKTAHYEQ